MVKKTPRTSNHSEPFLLGADVGTNRCKVGIVDSRGFVISSSSREYSVTFNEHGWAEQSPTTWWHAFRECVRDIVSHYGSELKRVTAMTVSGQSPTVVPVDREGAPLCNALLWLDRRAIKQSELLDTKIGKKRIFNLCGMRLDPSFCAPKILWLREFRPKIFEKAHFFLEAKDYMNFRLTGRMATDSLQAAGFLGYSLLQKKWDEEMLREMGVPLSKLPDVYAPCSQIGYVDREASSELAIPEGIPVGAGTIDAITSSAGVGVVGEGSMMDVTGTSTVLITPIRKLVLDESMRLLTLMHLDGDSWLLDAPLSTTGSVLKWFRDNISEYAKKNVGRKKVNAYDSLLDEASRSPPGSRGVIVLPYFAGERAPVWDGEAKSLIYGTKLTSNRKDVLRAIVEGTCFAVKQNMQIMESAGAHIHEVRVGGGAARSDFWCQTKADILQKKVLVTQVEETEVLGAAIISSVVAGFHKSVKSACGDMVHVARSFEPNSSVTDVYEKSYRTYRELYPKLLDTMHT